MRSHSLLLPVLGVLAVGLLLGCGSGGGSSTGQLAVSMTDAPFPVIDDCLQAALIEVDRVEVKAQGVEGESWLEIPILDEDGDGLIVLDVLDLRNGLAEALAFGELPTGTYSEIRLRIVSATLVFTDGSPSREFTVPSGASSGLKIKIRPAAVIVEDQTTPLLLDLDIAESFHTTGLGGEPTCDDLKEGETKVIFNPVVRAFDMNQNGAITGTVFDAAGAPMGGVEVTAFLAGTVVDAETVPVASTFSTEVETESAALGTYALLVEPGTYDLYVRAQGVEDRTLAASGVAVAAGQIVTGQDLVVPAP